MKNIALAFVLLFAGLAYADEPINVGQSIVTCDAGWYIDLESGFLVVDMWNEPILYLNDRTFMGQAPWQFLTDVWVQGKITGPTIARLERQIAALTALVKQLAALALPELAPAAIDAYVDAAMEDAE